eukprot:6240582-Prymnesium_polylepis.2
MCGWVPPVDMRNARQLTGDCGDYGASRAEACLREMLDVSAAIRMGQVRFGEVGVRTMSTESLASPREESMSASGLHTRQRDAE